VHKHYDHLYLNTNNSKIKGAPPKIFFQNLYTNLLYTCIRTVQETHKLYTFSGKGRLENATFNKSHFSSLPLYKMCWGRCYRGSYVLPTDIALAVYVDPLTQSQYVRCAVARQRRWMQRQQYSLPVQPGCYTLSKIFLARNDVVSYLHSNDFNHAYQSAHRHLQVITLFKSSHFLPRT